VVEAARRWRRDAVTGTSGLDGRAWESLIRNLFDVRELCFKTVTQLWKNCGTCLKEIPIIYMLQNFGLHSLTGQIVYRNSTFLSGADHGLDTVVDHIDIAARALVNLLNDSSQQFYRARIMRHFLDPYLNRLQDRLGGPGTTGLDGAYWAKARERFWLFASLEQCRLAGLWFLQAMDRESVDETAILPVETGFLLAKEFATTARDQNPHGYR